MAEDTPKRKYSLVAVIVLANLVLGLAIYLNIIAHPTRQPALTAYITVASAAIEGFAVWYLTKTGQLKIE